MMERTPRVSADTPTHIMVMDDTPVILELLQKFLEVEGYWVTTCRDLLDLPQIHGVQPDAILQEVDSPATRSAATDRARLDIPGAGGMLHPIGAQSALATTRCSRLHPPRPVADEVAHCCDSRASSEAWAMDAP